MFKQLLVFEQTYRKIQDNLSDIRSGNLEKQSDQNKICLTE